MGILDRMKLRKCWKNTGRRKGGIVKNYKYEDRKKDNMEKLKPEDLDRITEKIKRITLLRDGKSRAKVIVHMGTCGIAAGGRNIMRALMDEIEENDTKDVIVTISSCAGLCSREPMITVVIQDQPAVKYVDLTPEKVKVIFDKHVINGEIVTEYALAMGNERML